MPLQIEDYAMIGDCHSAALVGRDGSIDWLCWPRFDSGGCFAALLGTSENGQWLIAPVSASPNVSRRYLADTLILETEFQTETGTATLVDFMPATDGEADLVRIVFGRSGEVKFHTELVIRFAIGLLAEEFDPLTGRMLGNFPQAYCHVGIINCALNLSRQKGPAEERAQSSERDVSH